MRDLIPKILISKILISIGISKGIRVKLYPK